MIPDSMPALYALSGIRLTIISGPEYHRQSIYQLLIYPMLIEQSHPMTNESSPLTPAELQILLSLADGEQHGYGIMQEVAGRTDGRTKIGPGTLYGTIKRLLAAGMIVESARRPDPRLDDQRRRYYRITAAGKRALAEEIRAMADIVALARKRRILAASAL
jgi:DNA-binding PadR family transcriptional regulator